MSKREPPKPARRARIAPDPHGRTLRQADARAERLTTLSRLTRLMTSATDSAAAFHGIAEAATVLLKARMAYVWVDHGDEILCEGGSFWAGPWHSLNLVRRKFSRCVFLRVSLIRRLPGCLDFPGCW